MSNESASNGVSAHLTSDKSPLSLFETLADEIGIVTGRIEREVGLKVTAALSELRFAVSDIERRYVDCELKLSAFMANLQQRELELELRVVRMEHSIKDRLADLKDGVQGPQGERGLIGERGESGLPGERGPEGLQGPVGEPGPVGERGEPGPQGEIGPSGSVGERGEQGFTGRAGEQGLEGRQGVPGPSGEIGPAGPEGAMGSPGERGETGLSGQRGEPGSQGIPGPIGERGEMGLKGDIGERGEMGLKGDIGERGSDGKLTQVKIWVEGKVYYENDVVACDGGTYQALHDTAGHPGCSDWIVLSLPGRDGKDGSHGSDGRDGKDGRSFVIRGTYAFPTTKYNALDVVTLNSTWFVAKKDNPGECPGPDWQSGPTGKRGDKGERGERGLAGAKGDDGLAAREIIDWVVDTRGYTATPILNDGTLGPAITARQWFEQYSDERGE